MTRITKLCNTKDIVTVNGMYPGPVLYAQEDDKMAVRVTNESPHNITIHWYAQQCKVHYMRSKLNIGNYLHVDLSGMVFVRCYHAGMMVLLTSPNVRSNRGRVLPTNSHWWSRRALFSGMPILPGFVALCTVPLLSIPRPGYLTPSSLRMKNIS